MDKAEKTTERLASVSQEVMKIFELVNPKDHKKYVPVFIVSPNVLLLPFHNQKSKSITSICNQMHQILKCG